MRTLFLDLASNHGALACMTESEVTRLQPIDHRMDDRGFVSLIQTMLDDAGWPYADLTCIACVLGPGGFTSLRVGVAAANALAGTLDIPSCGIHLSDLYGARATQPNLWWLHSTKKHELFVRGFGAQAKEVPKARCVTIDELPSLLWEGGIWMGELIPAHLELIQSQGLTEAIVRPLQEILPLLLSSQSSKKQTLEPWYGRGW
jgi:tRNA threonylcarbamoyl adenosine modification protein YeaZ